MIRSSSSLHLELSIAESSGQPGSQTEHTLPKDIRGIPLQASSEARQPPFTTIARAPSSTGKGNDTRWHNQDLTIQWLAHSWLGVDNQKERIATVGPKQGIGLVSQSLLEHHIDVLPGQRSSADFVAVRNKAGEHAGYRAKVRTWPLLKRET